MLSSCVLGKTGLYYWMYVRLAPHTEKCIGET